MGGNIISRYRIHPIEEDEKLNTRVLEIKINDKTIVTPGKIVEKFRPEGELYEYPVQFNAELLEQILSGNFGTNELGSKKNGNRISAIPSKPVGGLLNVMLPSYMDKQITNRQLSKMESMQYRNSDILVLPRWDGVIKYSDDPVIECKKLNSRYIEEIRTLNHKMILGFLPLSWPLDPISELIDDFHNQDIVSFVVDYHTCASKTKSDLIRDIQKKLIKLGIYDESFLYSINSRRTSLINKSFYPADDFLLFGHGIDIIGNLHLGGGSGSGPIIPIKRFDSSDYKYVKDANAQQYSSEHIRADNYATQQKETRKLIDIIKEEGSAYNYVSKKEGVKPSLKKMMRDDKTDSNQRSFDDLF